jgi:ubiquinone/menaquinone biosynthesis C-methylase UbiE
MTDKAYGFDASGHFDQLSDKYDDLIGLVTGDIGRYALDNLIPNPISDSVIHDNACGTGLITEHLQRMASKTGGSPKLIHATDFVPSVTQVLQRKVSRNGWKGVDIAVMDSQQLNFPDNYFDLSITNFGIFFLPDPQQGANHIYRTLKPGGVAVVTTWKERRIMETIEEAQKTIRPDLKTLQSPWAGYWAEETALPKLLATAGFAANNVKIVEKRTDALVDAFLRDPEMVARAYPAAVEGWTDAEKARLGTEMLRIAKERDPEGGGAGGLWSVAYIAIAQK